MRTIAVANLKGGTGKTATCHALGVALASEHERHVLLVDCDPQGSLTGACGVHDAKSKSLAEVLNDSFGRAIELELVMYNTIRKVQLGLDLVPGHVALARTEQRLATRNQGEFALRNALGAVALRYSVALLDCPPELGLLMINALAAADAVLIPTMPNILDLRALKLFLSAIQDLRTWLNPRLEILGILVTFFDSRTIHHERIVDAMQGLGLPVLDVMIGRSVRVAEASNAGQSIVDYEPWHKEAEAYRQLGAVVERWISRPRQMPS